MNEIKELAYQRLMMNFPQAAIELYLEAGTAEAVYQHRSDIRQLTPHATDYFINVVSGDWDNELRWAEKELEWCNSKHIRFLYPSHPDYPQRLLNCVDAPVGLFSMGNANLNSEHVISIVGTRQSTAYGHDMIHNIIQDLKCKVPDTLVVSGLAYGIDVCAHKEALSAKLPTVGVLAHGLDTMYPASHRNIAATMLHQGGLLTEYPSHTRGDRQNFLRRNRIVAGMSDCTIVAESMSHGGSLVTARIANEYNREVFAIPGRISDKTSEGCNDLIHSSKASMLMSADDIIESLGWTTQQMRADVMTQGIQPSLFPSLTDEQQTIVNALRDGDLQLNMLAIKTGMPIGRLSALLFEMEMKGMLKAYAGGTYHLMLH